MSTSRTSAGGSVLKNSGEQLNGSPVKGARESAGNERPLFLMAQNMPNRLKLLEEVHPQRLPEKLMAKNQCFRSVVSTVIVIVGDASSFPNCPLSFVSRISLSKNQPCRIEPA